MKTQLLTSQDIHTGSLILVNPSYAYCPLKTPDLLPVTELTPYVQMERRACLLLSELMKKINGWEKILPVSGWRSLQEQQKIWDDSEAEHGPDFTRKFVAVPGHSEHQTGLAIDLGMKKGRFDFIRPKFSYSGICGKFRSHAAGYGFVERYPAGKEAITGIGHEPWHFRYVGIPHAFIMEEKQLTLEEYIDFIRDYPYNKRPYRCMYHGLTFYVSYLEASQEGFTTIETEEKLPYSISGNNVDGFILTEWR